MPFSPTDTIVAIATAPVRAGIGVVRISGPLAHGVAGAILSVSHDLEPRHATLTHVREAVRDVESRVASQEPGSSRRSPGSSDPGIGSAARQTPRRALDQVVATDFPAPPAFAEQTTAGFGEASPLPRAIDEVVATYFPAPHSYTAEDVVEISAHGSVALLREIVRAAIAAGARLAEPGEFTLRAFLNGRLDLVQAEAVADLVDAVTPLQARVAFDQLEGTLTRTIGAIDRELFDLAARLEASVDFPDEGYHFVGAGETAAVLGRVCDDIDGLLATSRSGRVIREGRHIAILGKPNVGKSSLFNQLVGTDRAIVAAGPGTTRDMLRETIDLDGIRLGLVDTAGIRASEDEVEREGVTRARLAAGVADLVVLVLDRSRPLEDVDRALLHETASSTRVVVVNKTDLPGAWESDVLGPGSEDPGLHHDSEARSLDAAHTRPDPPTDTGPPGSRVRTAQPVARQIARDTRDHESRIPNPGPRMVLLSLKTGAGLDELRAAMHEALEIEEPSRDAAVVTNVRHETLLRRAREAVARAIENLEQAGESASEELVLADIADARGALEEVTGKRTTEDLLQKIFERFCIGK